MSENENCGLVGALEDGADEEVEVVCPCWVFRIVRGEFEDDEVGLVWEVVSAAEGEVGGVSLAHGTVREFRGGVREDAVPPFEEPGWVASWRDWIVAGTVASGDCREKLLFSTQSRDVRLVDLPEPPRMLIVTGSPDNAL